MGLTTYYRAISMDLYDLSAYVCGHYSCNAIDMSSRVSAIGYGSFILAISCEINLSKQNFDSALLQTRSIEREELTSNETEVSK
jgi:hypothetical protein